MKLKLLIVITIVIICSCTLTVRMDKDFEQERNKINKITVLPPRFEFFERGATLNESKPEYLPQINEYIVDAINYSLSSANFNVVPNDISDEVLEQNQEMALILSRSYDEYLKLLDKIDDSDKNNLSLSLNPDIGIFADYTDAEHLVFVVGSGYISSEGAKVKDVGLSCLSGLLFGTGQHSQWSGMHLFIAVVNANSSKIIWFNKNTRGASDYDPLNPNDVLDLCRWLLKEGMTGNP
ncbi:MAG: hypothetical protein JW866_02075 [Ignavibacteriales bacterium]|nr:hypothetical protein [Ignavibacteriales bacterium]